MRLGSVAIAVFVLRAAAARADESTAPPSAPSDIGQAEVEAARQRAEARHIATEQRAAADIAAAKAADTDKRNKVLGGDLAFARERRQERRNAGWLLVGTGAASVALGGFFAWRSAVVNSDIRAGGYYSSYEIEDRAVDGQIYNNCAWAFGLSGALAVAIGTGVVLTTHVDEINVAPAIGPGGAGVTFSGTLP